MSSRAEPVHAVRTANLIATIAAVLAFAWTIQLLEWVLIEVIESVVISKNGGAPTPKSPSAEWAYPLIDCSFDLIKALFAAGLSWFLLRRGVRFRASLARTIAHQKA